MEAIIFIMAFCAVISFISFKSTFYGLKLISGMSWFGMLIWFLNTNIVGFEEGTGARTAIVVITIGFGLMIPIAGLFRGVQRTDRWSNSNGNDVEETHTSFHLPSWMHNMTVDENSPEHKRENLNRHRAEYEDKWDRAMRTGKYSNRRR
jgi:hypothetical protein